MRTCSITEIDYDPLRSIETAGLTGFSVTGPADSLEPAAETAPDPAELPPSDTVPEPDTGYFRALIENSTDVISVVDVNGIRRYTSPSVQRVLGFRPDELVGRSGFDLIHPEDIDSLRTHFNQVIDGPDPVAVLEFRVKHRDGDWRVMEGCLRNLLHDPLVAGLVINSRDITKRKLTEQELHKNDERYRDLIENAHDIIYSIDLAGNYTSINRAVEHITGYTREEALQMNFDQVIAPEQLSTVRQMIARKMRGENFTAYESEIVGKDGRRIPIEINTSIIREDGVPVGGHGIARDISERKRLEDQLRQSQKMEAIGQLVGGIAHDFNNMLTAINGYSDLALRKMPADDPLRRNLEGIKKAGERSADLTYQLLAFSRQQVLQPKVISFGQIITETGKLLERLIGEDVQLITKISTGTGLVMVDPGQLSQIIVNLAVNARDAMPAGGTLMLETDNVLLDQEYERQNPGTPAGSYVTLAVIDTGHGMDAATQRHIFEPFFTTKEIGKGTGLGLATVYGIVRQSGGSISVSSEVGVGTTFRILLPRVFESAPGDRDAWADSTLAGGTETILLVEDEDIVRGLTRLILEGCGYQVVEARNGAKALTLWEQDPERIKLILTDVVMPQMGGRELADRVATLAPGLPILFTSGYTDDAIVRHNVTDAAANFIQKPFTTDDLANKVRDILDQQRFRQG